MSFLRHAGIYRSDGDYMKTRGGAPPPVGRPPALVQERDGRNNAFCSSSAMSSRAGYSLASCSPAEPASASPTGSSMRWSITTGNELPANGNLSLISVSQQRGSVQAVPCFPLLCPLTATLRVSWLRLKPTQCELPVRLRGVPILRQDGRSGFGIVWAFPARNMRVAQQCSQPLLIRRVPSGVVSEDLQRGSNLISLRPFRRQSIDIAPTSHHAAGHYYNQNYIHTENGHCGHLPNHHLGKQGTA